MLAAARTQLRHSDTNRNTVLEFAVPSCAWALSPSKLHLVKTCHLTVRAAHTAPLNLPPFPAVWDSMYFNARVAAGLRVPEPEQEC